MNQEPVRGTLVIYNPYVLQILYLKAYYLDALLDKYYHSRQTFSTDAYYRMMRSMIPESPVSWITRESLAMQQRVEKERFGFDLVYCNIEYFLYRFTQIYRLREESLDHGFINKPYKCEVLLSRLFVNGDEETLRHSLYTYLEYYYLSPSQDKMTTRIDLFFLLKKTLEADSGEKKSYVLRYTKEMIAILVQLYLVNEFIGLCGQESNEIQHATLVPLFEYQKEETTVPVLTTDDSSSTIPPLLVKMQATLKKAFIQECILNTRYPAATETKTVPQQPTFGEALKDIFFNTGVVLEKQEEEEEEDDYKKFTLANDALNAPMRIYEEPPPALVSIATTEDKANSIYAPRLHIEYDEKTLRARVIKQYAYLRFETKSLIEYNDMVFRLLLEAHLHEAHRHCRHARTKKTTTSACTMCDYFTLVDKKVREFYRLMHHYTVNHCYAEEYKDREKLDASLPDQYLCPMSSPLVARVYKVLYTIAHLYARLAFIPLPQTKPVRERCLMTMIDPVKLFEALARPLVTEDLEQEMTRLIVLCNERVGCPPKEEPCQQTLDLALEVEFVKLIINAINAQQTEIEKYERSLTIDINLNSSSLHTHVIHNLKLIYAAYLHLLCQSIRREYEKVSLV